MTVDRSWMIRNLGFDPVQDPAPAESPAFKKASTSSSTADLQREIIDFDSEGPEGAAFFAISTATGLSKFKEIPWPAGLAPKTAAAAGGVPGGPLPKADVLVVTWTVDEGHALSRVLTPGKDSRNDYAPYTHNFATLSKMFRKESPALEAKRLGMYWSTTIRGKSVLVFKSDSHLSQDGPQIPNIEVWKQLLEEVKPSLVLTTGTGGGIGVQFEVGDVIVSPIVRFDCIKKFKARFGGEPPFSSSAANTKHFEEAAVLFGSNAAQLPKDNTRAPRIVNVALHDVAASVVTTDFFGFDTSDNHYQLQGLGDLSEMGDAVLGFVCSQMGPPAPRWLAVRNVSDPQISSVGTTLEQQANMAAQIYKGFGRWSTVCSAITCWALIAAE
jgi:nucleoside phosphorylase